MMKKYYPVVGILALVAALGLSRAGEMEELHLITALAVDRQEGAVAVTAVTGVRAGEGEEPVILTGRGSDLPGALRDMGERRPSRAYLGQADKLLLGEDLARGGLMEVLEFVLDHRELGLDTLLYIVRGSSGEGLAATAPAMAGETPGRDKRGVSVGQALARLCAGRSVQVPALAAGEDGMLAPGGWAILEPRGLMGYASDALQAERGGGWSHA